MSHKTTENCDPKDIALKSFFLGPQSENASWAIELITGIFKRWFEWRQSLFPDDGNAISNTDQVVQEFTDRIALFEKKLNTMLGMLESEVPKFSPRYVGHMFSEISLPALLGHLAALVHNPNNISSESSQIGIKIETLAIEKLTAMIGYPPTSRGHFTSGGTIANIEALIRARTRLAFWLGVGAHANHQQNASFNLFDAAHMGWQRAREIGNHPDVSRYIYTSASPFEALQNLRLSFSEPFHGPIILAPASSHYSWKKGAFLLGLGDEGIWPVELDANARMSIQSLRCQVDKARNEHRPILAIVSIAGSTELGQFDPIDEVQNFIDELATKDHLHIWHHIDAAYGGFFNTIDKSDPPFDSKPIASALSGMQRANSITLDPHKLGYVPYSSGVALVRNPSEYIPMASDIPYVQFTSQDPGPYTLEGSRAATGAAATWLTSEVIGLDSLGYGRILARTIHTRERLQKKLLASSVPVRIAPGCVSNILCFTIARSGESLSKTNDRIKNIYKKLSPQAHGPFILAKTSIHRREKSLYFDQFVASWKALVDCEEINFLRMCLLNPFFDSKEMNTNFVEDLIQTFEKLLSED